MAVGTKKKRGPLSKFEKVSELYWEISDIHVNMSRDTKMISAVIYSKICFNTFKNPNIDFNHFKDFLKGASNSI